MYENKTKKPLQKILNRIICISVLAGICLGGTIYLYWGEASSNRTEARIPERVNTSQESIGGEYIRYISGSVSRTGEAIYSSRAYERIERRDKYANGVPIDITTYNLVRSQTDDTPNHGATGENLRVLASKGVRVIALSMDLIYGTKTEGYCKEDCFSHYGDRVKIVSDTEQCSGEYQVWDVMNSRFTKRADIMYLDPRYNTSCKGIIYNITK